MQLNSSTDKLVLLHLSDIHFRQPYCLDASTDIEHAVRQLLLNDIEEMKEITGPVDLIFVTGDIAFQGHPDEYIVAKTWLAQIAQISGCKETSVFVVPGNHDVDRNSTKIKDVIELRKEIMDVPLDSGRDKKLHDVILKDDSALTLLRPIENFNVLAATYKCNVSKVPFWTQVHKLSEGWDLVIHGLNSALFSGPESDRIGKLYLGALQRAFAKEDGKIRIALSHHPPEYFEDHGNVDDALWNACEIHLLGHKHRQRYLATDTSIRYSAGAVNPSRADGRWEPGYNIIQLQVVESEKGPILEVNSHLRLWQSSPDRFVAKITAGGKDTFTHSIILHRKASPASEKLDSEVADNLSLECTGNAPAGEAAMTTLTRDIALKFWSLTTSERWTLTKNLGLLEEGDGKLPEPLRYERAFERAREQGKTADLAAKINDIITKRGA
jgi:predicted MPP superfamily phosphohydrolase